MRLSFGLVAALLAGCAGPHTTGALWAQQNLEREAALFRSSEAERAGRAHAYELGLGDAALAAERARVEAALQDCPGERRPLALSAGDKVRDTIRLQAQVDPARLGAVAQVALADWYFRRGRATGLAQFCDRARQALSTPPSDSGAIRSGVLESVGEATVARGQRLAVSTASSSDGEPLVTLSLYATQVADAVRAPAPLPQYLATVYGGQLAEPSTPVEGTDTLVDDLAPAYPQWEPDALYVALGGVS